jgi:hypothetical protein
VIFHRFGLTDGSDDGVSFGEEVLGHRESHTIASACDYAYA